jgi:chemotaxis family two-component system response regulator Rcp1
MDQEVVEKKRVLLVADDPECVALIGRTLEDIGLRGSLDVSRDCDSALALLRQSDGRNPRLVLLDLEMPEGAGLSFLETVKTDPTLRMIPIVVLADRDDPETVAVCYDLGVAGYVARTDTGSGFAEKIRSTCSYWALSRVPTM